MNPPAAYILYPGVQALELSQCVLAALWHSRALTLNEIAARLDGVGRKVSASVLSCALVDLRDKLALDPWFPFVLVEAGTQWTLGPKHPALETLAGDGKIHPAQPLSADELMVLSIIVFNGPDGTSRTAIQRGAGIDPAAAIDHLRDEGLIYAIPGETFDYWRPSPEILRRFGLKRFSDLPGYQDFHAYLGGKSSRLDAEKTAEKELRRAAKKENRAKTRVLAASQREVGAD